jgi:5,10-methylenetetrahydromethanopterin reductase
VKLGVAIEPGRSLDEAVTRAKLAERLAYHSIWCSQLPTARDTSLVLATFAQATERILFGTAVLPIYVRHPTQMAQMAQTLDEISNHRFLLGIGVSHKVTVENMWGLHLDEPVQAMREYMQILRDSFRSGGSSVEGRYFTARWAYSAPRNENLPIIVAALGEKMLELAGEIADGVSLWMCSPEYVSATVIPAVTRGRQRAGKSLDGFEVMAVIPVGLSADSQGPREAFRGTVERYAGLPFYRRMMEASGFKETLDRGEISDAMLADLGGIGSIDDINRLLERYRQAGLTLAAIGPMPKSQGSVGVEATLEAVIG